MKRHGYPYQPRFEGLEVGEDPTVGSPLLSLKLCRGVGRLYRANKSPAVMASIRPRVRPVLQ